MTSLVPEIRLNDLFERPIPGIYPHGGRLLADACRVCLYQNEHQDSVHLGVSGSMQHSCVLDWWIGVIDEGQLRFWHDNDRAVEWGAEAIAILLVLQFTEFTIIDRSYKGTGFDYWLAKNDDDPLFARAGRLEVSGILTGDESDIKARVRKKVKQTKQSDHLRLPVFAVVVEFSRPVAHIERR